MAISFLKRGADAHKALQKAEKEAEARAAARGAFRFWLKEGDERMITFLDGDLTDDGLLDTVSFNQHQVKMNGKFRNYFVCTAESEPCPLCEMPDTFPTLVSCFTVLDHSEYTDRNGKKHQHERKLFVAKRDTMKRLQKLATKRGGLRGWTVSVSRIGDKSPEVGTDFDFIEQQDLPELAKLLKLKPEQVLPFDYDKEIRYLSADELRELGFGSAVVGKAEASAVLGKAKAKAKAKPKDDDDDGDDDDDAPAAPAFLKGKASKATGDKPKKSLFAKTAKAEKDDDADDDPPFDADDDDDDNDL